MCILPLIGGKRTRRQRGGASISRLSTASGAPITDVAMRAAIGRNLNKINEIIDKVNECCERLPIATPTTPHSRLQAARARARESQASRTRSRVAALRSSSPAAQQR